MSRLLISLFVALMLFLGGCGGAGGGKDTDATMRVFNSICDSTSIEFVIDDDVFGTPLAYLGSTPNFSRLEAKEYDFRIREAGSSNELWAIVATLAAERNYVLVAVGLENFAVGEEEKRAQILGIDVDRSIPNGNKARIFIVHNYNRAAGFDTPNIDFQTPGDNPLFKIENIEPQNFEVTEIDADGVTPVTVEARRAGTENVLASATTTPGAGKIYLVLVTGLEGGVGQQAPQIVFLEMQTK
ncbi:MAG: hypothetical protein WAO58_10330 [Fimbriimonadaceae bacterium]